MPARRSIRVAATLATAAAAAGIAIAAAAPVPGEPARGAEPALIASDAQRGEMRLASSNNGRPILTATDLVPGRAISGRVRITNASTEPATISLRTLRLSDVPGAGGRPLSAALELQISTLRASLGRRPRIIYAGALAAMPRLRLGRWPAGAEHRFRFRIELPDQGIPSTPSTGDNAYQGASASVGFAWRARPLSLR